MDCCVCLEEITLPITTDCNHHFCFLCLKSLIESSNHPVCPLCRSPLDIDLNHLQVDENLVNDATESYQWQYHGKNYGWWDYDERSNKEIEEAYVSKDLGSPQSGLPGPCIIFIGHKSYSIDFTEMTQKNLTDPSKIRKVRRIDRNSSDHHPKGTGGVAHFVQS